MNYLKEHKIAIIKMISELQKTMHEQNESITREKENGKMRETEMTELKNVTKFTRGGSTTGSIRQKKETANSKTAI